MDSFRVGWRNIRQIWGRCRYVRCQARWRSLDIYFGVLFILRMLSAFWNTWRKRARLDFSFLDLQVCASQDRDKNEDKYENNWESQKGIDLSFVQNAFLRKRWKEHVVKDGAEDVSRKSEILKWSRNHILTIGYPACEFPFTPASTRPALYYVTRTFLNSCFTPRTMASRRMTVKSLKASHNEVVR